MYVVCINYLLRPTEPICVCEADVVLGSADHAAMVYLQCVLYVCVCHRSQFRLGCLCVYCMWLCVCHRSPLQVGVFVCVLYVVVCVPQVSTSSWGVCVCTMLCVCSTDCRSPKHTARGYNYVVHQ